MTDDATYRKVMWRLMPFLVLCYLAAFVDRSNVGFAKLQFMHDLGLSEAAYGLGAGLFYAGYMLFEVPSNLYLAARGFRRTLLRIMVLWGVASAAMAFMRDAQHFYVLRALLGAAEAGFFPGVLLYLTYWVPRRARARFTSVFMSSVALSGVVGGPLAGGIMSLMDGRLGMKGWQWLFLAEGLPSCLIGVVGYFYLNDGPREAKWLSEAERNVIIRDLEADSHSRGGGHTSVLRALRDPRLYFFCAMAYALFASVGGIFLWLPTILRNSGVTSVWKIGLLSAIPFGVGALAQLLNGRSSDRHLERRWHTVVPVVIAAIGWALLPRVSSSPAMSVGLLVLITAGTLAATGPFWTMPSAVLSGTAAAAGIAIVSAVGSVGNLVSPIIVGWVASHTGSLAAGQYYLAGILVLGALALVAASARGTLPALAQTSDPPPASVPR